jgi:hypothetical protein
LPVGRQSSRRRTSEQAELQIGSINSVPRIIHWPLFGLRLCCSRSSLHLLTAAFGTFETSTDVRSAAAFGGNADINQRFAGQPRFMSKGSAHGDVGGAHLPEPTESTPPFLETSHPLRRHGRPERVGRPPARGGRGVCTGSSWRNKKRKNKSDRTERLSFFFLLSFLSRSHSNLIANCEEKSYYLSNHTNQKGFSHVKSVSRCEHTKH